MHVSRMSSSSWSVSLLCSNPSWAMFNKRIKKIIIWIASMFSFLCSPFLCTLLLPSLPYPPHPSRLILMSHLNPFLLQLHWCFFLMLLRLHAYCTSTPNFPFPPLFLFHVSYHTAAIFCRRLDRWLSLELRWLYVFNVWFYGISILASEGVHSLQQFLLHKHADWI